MIRRLILSLACVMSAASLQAASYGTVYISSVYSATGTPPYNFLQMAYVNGVHTWFKMPDEQIVAPVPEGGFYYERPNGWKDEIVFTNVRLPEGMKLDQWVLAMWNDLKTKLSDVTNPSLVLPGAPTATIPGGEVSRIFKHWDTGPIIYTVPCFSWLNYKLHYDTTYGSVEQDKTYCYTNRLSVTSAKPERPGYSFLGWGKSPNAAKLFKAGETVTGADLEATTNGLVTLYANWKQNEYAVTFKYHDNTGEISKSQKVKGTETAIPPTKAEVDKWTDHVFKGWDASYENVVSNMTVNAIYDELFFYTIKFDRGEDGEGEMDDMRILCGTSTNLVRCAYTRTGHRFVEWKSTFGGSERYFPDGGLLAQNLAEANVRLTFVAQWAPNRYTVRFDANGGTGSMSDQSLTYSEQKPLTDNVFVKNGYTFVGWNTQPDGSGQAFAPRAQVSQLVAENDGSITLYAQWTANGYTVTFDANGGTGSTDPVNAVYDKAFALPSGSFVKTGYHLAGWATNATDAASYKAGASVSNLTDVANGSYVLYASWAANAYTIVYWPNGGKLDESGEMEATDARFDTPVTLRTNAYVKAGYTFDSWNTVEDGSGTMYANGATVLNLGTNENDIVSLYAQWRPIRYTIRFDANGGTGTMDDLTDCAYGDSITITSNKFTRAGRAFAGWTVAGGSAFYEDGASVSNLTTTDGDTVTLLAQWESADGDLKKALDLDPKDETFAVVTSNSVWSVVTSANEIGPESGSSFLMAAQADTLAIELPGPGTLSFAWRTVDTTKPKPATMIFLSVHCNDSQAQFGLYGTTKDWETKTYEITSEGPNVVSWKFAPRNGNQSAYLDHVVWTPAGGGAEPTEEDAPVISAMDANGLRFTGDARFDYQLLGSDDLSEPLESWQVLETKSGADGQIEFGDLFKADTPQMFYRVRVIRKQQ